jgi:hypothetical protein
MDDGISSKLTQFEGLRSFTGPLNWEVQTGVGVLSEFRNKRTRRTD